MTKTRILVTVGLLIALDIILTRFLAIQTPILRISLGFIPLALSGMLFGPLTGGITAALSDILGMMILPSGAYFPGFTFSAFCSGCIYGIFLHKKERSLLRTALAVTLIISVVDLGLNTLWLSFITGKAALILLWPRLTKSLLILPVQVFLIHTLCRSVADTFSRYTIRPEHDPN